MTKQMSTLKKTGVGYSLIRPAASRSHHPGRIVARPPNCQFGGVSEGQPLFGVGAKPQLMAAIAGIDIALWDLKLGHKHT